MQSDGAFPGVQSAFEPAGQGAEQIDALAFVLTAAGAAVFLVFCVALAYALTHRRRPAGPRSDESDRRSTRWIVAAGAAIPLLILVPLLFYTFHALSANDPARRDPALVVEVRGHQWWWEVRYADADPAKRFVTANEIRVPVGRPIELHLYSDDVIHSFWVPSLQGKMDLIPGRKTVLWLQADSAGVYRGQCAEYCGLQHARMVLQVHAEPPAEFEQWAARQRLAAAPRADSAGQAAEAAFLGSGCILCHTVRGTPAGGRLGPDLTHLASRATLAGGILPNNRANLMGWVANPQALKPGSRMPSVPLAPDTLHAIVHYLMGLE
ncbi:MAG TPA: cytochrome c oxidase subunit II [Gemmatimonadales bacterium]|nr:cytochrome c oxidase subunit II [Gemmatimonadales bacterium]